MITHLCYWAYGGIVGVLLFLGDWQLALFLTGLLALLNLANYVWEKRNNLR